LYCFQRAPRAWYERIEHFFLNHGCKRCELHHDIYVLHVHSEALIIAVYVNDLVIIGSNVDLILGFKKQLADTFDSVGLGLLNLDFGIEFLQMDDDIFVY